MNFAVLVIALLFIMVLCKFMTVENFRGGRGRGRRGGRRWRGGGWRRRFNPYSYLRRFRRRQPMYPYWNNFYTYPSIWSYNYVPCNCKIGCTPDGCAFPGNGPNDCVWASDCNCC